MNCKQCRPNGDKFICSGNCLAIDAISNLETRVEAIENLLLRTGGIPFYGENDGE